MLFKSALVIAAVASLSASQILNLQQPSLDNAANLQGSREQRVIAIELKGSRLLSECRNRMRHCRKAYHGAKMLDCLHRLGHCKKLTDIYKRQIQRRKERERRQKLRRKERQRRRKLEKKRRQLLRQQRRRRELAHRLKLENERMQRMHQRKVAVRGLLHEHNQAAKEWNRIQHQWRLQMAAHTKKWAQVQRKLMKQREHAKLNCKHRLTNLREHAARQRQQILQQSHAALERMENEHNNRLRDFRNANQQALSRQAEAMRGLISQLQSQLSAKRAAKRKAAIEAARKKAAEAAAKKRAAEEAARKAAEDAAKKKREADLTKQQLENTRKREAQQKADLENQKRMEAEQKRQQQEEADRLKTEGQKLIDAEKANCKYK